MDITTYTVIGMTCQHCVASVSEEVREIPGVDAVEVDLATGALRISSTQPIPDEAVRGAVEGAGYQLA